MTKGKPDTKLTHGGKASTAGHDFVNPPIVRGSTVLHASVADMKERSRRYRSGEPGPVNYGTYGTPTHHALFDLLSELEGAHRSWAVPSGLTACTVAMLAFVRAGDHVLVTDAAYGPTRRFCIDMLPRYGVECTFYSPTAAAGLESMFRSNTRLLWMESPGSLTFEMQDVPLLTNLARSRGVVTVVDSTWATPLYFQPLKCGADVSVHAATKYICGHSDTLMGTIACNETAWPLMRETLFNFGLLVGPDDAYVALRGLRTLGVAPATAPGNRRTFDRMATHATRGRAHSLSGIGRRSRPRPVEPGHERRERAVRHRIEAQCRRPRASKHWSIRWSCSAAAIRGAATKAC